MIYLTDQEKAAILAANPTMSDFTSLQMKTPVPEIDLEYYFKRASGKWGDQIFIYHMGEGARAWIDRKGFMVFLAKRKATRLECIDNHLRIRMHYQIYRNWEKLIEDECRELAEYMNEEYRQFLDKLRKLSKEYSILK